MVEHEDVPENFVHAVIHRTLVMRDSISSLLVPNGSSFNVVQINVTWESKMPGATPLIWMIEMTVKVGRWKNQ